MPASLPQLPQIRQQEPADCHPLFASVLEEFPQYTNLAVTDLQGNLFCSEISLSNPINVSDRDYLQ